MSKKYQVQLIQLAGSYRGLSYIPYAIGLLRAYAEQFPEICAQFEFRPLLHQRDAVEAIVDRIGKVDILGLSSYVWNWRINLAIAQQVRQRYPDCLIFVGGPHVPDILGDFFFKYPFIDIACHGEGEITFYEMLKAFMGEGNYQEIIGLSYHDRATGKVTQNPQRARIRDLDMFPSPYLNGTFEHLYYVQIFNCQVLPNAEMGNPHYRQLHQIETVELPAFRRRSTPYENQDTTIEYEEIIVATATMSRKDWCRIYRFAWATLCFHWLGLVQLVAIFLKNRYEISYRTFYETILNHAVANPESVIGQELIALDRILDNVLVGRGFDNYIPEFCNINWPAEEATYLRLSQCRDQMYGELRHLTNQLLSRREIVIEEVLLNDLWRYQEARATHYEQGGDLRLDLNYNLHEYIRGCMLNKPVSLEKGDFVYRILDSYQFAGNKERLALELAWNRLAFKHLRSVVTQTINEEKGHLVTKF